MHQIDRLALELQLTPVEALHHVRRIIENVNALAFTLLTSESLILETKKEEAAAAAAAATATAAAAASGLSSNNKGTTTDASNAFTESVIEEWNFSPEKGNVVFSSALDCWGFGTLKFAALWSKKLGLNPKILNKYMFEDYYLNMDSKKIVKCDPDDPSSSNVPMFASLILEPIWQLYNAAITEKDPAKAASFALNEVSMYAYIYVYAYLSAYIAIILLYYLHNIHYFCIKLLCSLELL
jgi:ribosome assembly protein 1